LLSSNDVLRISIIEVKSAVELAVDSNALTVLILDNQSASSWSSAPCQDFLNQSKKSANAHIASVSRCSAKSEDDFQDILANKSNSFQDFLTAVFIEANVLFTAVQPASASIPAELKAAPIVRTSCAVKLLNFQVAAILLPNVSI